MMEIDKQELEHGDILRITKFPVYHYGIFDGKNVIHASKELNKVCIQFISDFLENQRPTIIKKGVNKKDREQAVSIAYSKVGDSYSLFSNNCEHFVNECYGHKHSTQLVVGILALFIALYFLAKAK